MKSPSDAKKYKPKQSQFVFFTAENAEFAEIKLKRHGLTQMKTDEKYKSV